MITVHAPITVNTYDIVKLAEEFAALRDKIDALSQKFEELRADQTELDRLTATLEQQQAALQSTVNTVKKEK